MRDIDSLFIRLAASTFRSRFHLKPADHAYIARKGVDAVLHHARDLLAARLQPREPQNDGKQTPMRGHPVFIAQHATGTCCRGCLAKWHGIPAGHELTEPELVHVLAVIERWIRNELGTRAPPGEPLREEPRRRSRRSLAGEETLSLPFDDP